MGSSDTSILYSLLLISFNPLLISVIKYSAKTSVEKNFDLNCGKSFKYLLLNDFVTFSIASSKSLNGINFSFITQ